MALPTRARIAGMLALGLLMLSAPAAFASGPYPDALIGLGNPPTLGDGVHNLDGVNQNVTGFGDVGDKQTFWIMIQNDGFPTDSFTVYRSGLFDEGFRVRYYNAAGKDVTGRVNKGTFTTPPLAPGAAYLMRATVKVRSVATACSSVTRLITVSSVNYPGVKDAVRFTEKLDTNCPPVAVDDANDITEDAVPDFVTGNVLGNDTDFNGDTLSVLNTNVPLYGGLVIDLNSGSYTYTLNNANLTVNGLGTGATLLDSISYTVDDGHGGTDSGTLNITIHGANDPPNPCLTADC